MKEERELSLIKRGLTLNGNTWEAIYPWTKEPTELPDNYGVALAMLTSTEKRLLKRPKIAMLYQQQMEEMVQMNFARKIPEEELRSHEGAVH